MSFPSAVSGLYVIHWVCKNKTFPRWLRFPSTCVGSYFIPFFVESQLFHSTNAVGVVKSDCVCGRCCSWRHRDVKRSVRDPKPVRRKRQADKNLEFDLDSWIATQSRRLRRGRSGEGEAESQPRAGGYVAVGQGRGKPANLKV